MTDPTLEPDPPGVPEEFLREAHDRFNNPTYGWPPEEAQRYEAYVAELQKRKQSRDAMAQFQDILKGASDPAAIAEMNAAPGPGPTPLPPAMQDPSWLQGQGRGAAAPGASPRMTAPRQASHGASGDFSPTPPTNRVLQSQAAASRPAVGFWNEFWGSVGDRTNLLGEGAAAVPGNVANWAGRRIDDPYGDKEPQRVPRETRDAAAQAADLKKTQGSAQKGSAPAEPGAPAPSGGIPWGSARFPDAARVPEPRGELAPKPGLSLGMPTFRGGMTIPNYIMENTATSRQANAQEMEAGLSADVPYLSSDDVLKQAIAKRSNFDAAGAAAIMRDLSPAHQRLYAEQTSDPAFVAGQAEREGVHGRYLAEQAQRGQLEQGLQVGSMQREMELEDAKKTILGQDPTTGVPRTEEQWFKEQGADEGQLVVSEMRQVQEGAPLTPPQVLQAQLEAKKRVQTRWISHILDIIQKKQGLTSGLMARGT